MSNSALKLLAASGATDSATYVDDVFSTHLYAGNNSTQAITNGIDLSGEGGMVWLKVRTEAQSHAAYDTERGVSKAIYPDLSSAQSTINGVSAFNNNGFTLGSTFNSNNQNYASWTFRKQPGFFDIVTYTGNGSSQNISHNLGTTPGFIIIKSTSHGSTYWSCWHRSIPTTYVLLNSTSAAVSGVSRTVNDSTFQVMNWNDEGANGRTYVAYLFAHDAQEFGTDSDESIIKCGSYTGNGGDLSINLGFEPQWVMVKPSSASGNWEVFDNMRGISSNNAYTLRPNSSNTEADFAGGSLTLNPTGFAVNVDFGVNTREYIYMAIRRPHKPASKFAATDLFNTVQGASSTANPGFNLGFAPDMAWEKATNGSSGHYIGSRMTGTKYLFTDATSAEAQSTSITWDYMNGWIDYFSGMDAYNAWGFKRAPGFFDVVAYSGTGSAKTVAHNLGVAPEMIWVKCRTSSSESWQVGHNDLDEGWDAFINLNNIRGEGNPNSIYWNDTAPTSTVFSIGTQEMVNQNGQDYIAYLFASAAGISKVGSYTGTGNDLNVDCGFSAGARFILIKRIDVEYTSGDWYIWDSVRGIVAGNDPYLLLNTTAAQVTNTDYVDPLASGFTVTSSAPAALNASGGTYIFYAIA